MFQNSFIDNKNKLYLIATPIGNLKEISFRTIEILNEVNLIFCEDTRVSQKLLNHFKIKKKLISLHKNNEKSRIQQVLSHLREFNVALICDAGYPLISDPGSLLVKEVINNGFSVIPISGPSAFINALVASGLDTNKFTFIGFLSSNKNNLVKQLNELKYHSETLIFYESPHRIKQTLELLLLSFKNRKVCLAREITKIHEQFYRTDLQTIVNNIENISKQGEYVIIIEGYQEQLPDFANLSIINHINLVIERSNININEAIKVVAQLRNLPKRVVYNEYHQIKNK